MKKLTRLRGWRFYPCKNGKEDRNLDLKVNGLYLFLSLFWPMEGTEEEEEKKMKCTLFI
jgi:hypothetical protein